MRFGAGSELPPVARILAADEHVARFIYSTSNIRKSQARPKPGVFSPSLHAPFELSVVHSSGLADSEIWDLGRQTLGNQPGRERIQGRADIPVQSLLDVRLRALRDDNPFKRHTSVIDWPQGSDDDNRKQLWKMITLELSEDVRICLALPVEPVIRLS
jgi:hypothetical protein